MYRKVKQSNKQINLTQVRYIKITDKSKNLGKVGKHDSRKMKACNRQKEMLSNHNQILHVGTYLDRTLIIITKQHIIQT